MSETPSPEPGIDAEIAALCARLAEASGARRLELLIGLGAAQYQRALSGLDAPDAAGRLAAAIETQRQTLDLAPADHPRRGDVLWRLGNLHAIRFAVLGGADADRDITIELFQEYLRLPEGFPDDVPTVGVWLGILLMSRALRVPLTIGGKVPDAVDFLPLMTGFQLSDDGERDLQSAIALFERFADADVDPLLRRMATAQHAMSMLLRTFNQPAEDGADMNHALALLGRASAELTADEAKLDLTDPVAWAAFTHQGR
jgi:hypothetical protein